MSDFVISPDARIDLHAHSLRSDGLETPATVMREAAVAGLNYIALTDHDTTAGWDEARATCQELGLGFIPGIEVTTRVTRKVAKKFGVHMLAYLPDPNHLELARVLKESVEGRIGRLREITDRLSKDFDITWEHVSEVIADGKVAGRPAIADAMVARGIFEDRTPFFDIVHKESQYYVPSREVPETIDAIALIRSAGGVPVIAHPMARGGGPKDGHSWPRAHFLELIEAGLGGFEVNHRDVSGEVRVWLSELADEFGLIVTGSSDYHGLDGKPNRLGENTTEPRYLEQILAEARQPSLALLSNGN